MFRHFDNGVDSALANPPVTDLHSAHAAVSRERDEIAAKLTQVATANAVLLLREHDDRTALRRLVGERGELGGIRQLLFADAAHGTKRRRLTIAEGDGAGLIQQERVDVAGRFHRPTRHRQHVETDETVHAGDADGRQQCADGRRDQRHEQRDQDDDHTAPPP